jgi:hypothetical protein
MHVTEQAVGIAEARHSGNETLGSGSLVLTPFGQSNSRLPGLVPKEIALRMFLGVTCIQAGFTVALLVLRLIV